MEFSIMGSHAGDGAVISARNHKEAFIKFICLDGLDKEEVTHDINGQWEKESSIINNNHNYIKFGNYEIKKISK
jgi:hypothetical protein